MTTTANVAAMQQPGQTVPLAVFQALQQKCDHFEQKYNQVSQELARLKSFLTWENKLFATSSDVMSDAQKVVARVMPRIVRRAKERTSTDEARDDGLARVYRKEIADLTGKSEDRAGATAIQLAENGLVKRKVIDVYDEKTHKLIDKHLCLDVTDSLMQVNIKAAEPRNCGNGQKNFICKACHSSNTKARRVYEVTCMDCGSVTYLDASKKADRAFIVDDNTAEHFDEWYGDVDEPEPQKNELVAQDMTPELQAPAEQIEPSVTVTKGEHSHSEQPPSHEHYNESLKSDVKGEPQVPSNTATSHIPSKIGGLPHCKHMNCLLGSNRTQPRFDGEYYCPIHRGFIDEKGQPL